MLLIDAKLPKDAACQVATVCPSTGAWRAISRRAAPGFFRAGSIPTPSPAAIALTGARGVDVSSGVERAPGVKDNAKIKAFVAAAGARSRARPRSSNE